MNEAPSEYLEDISEGSPRPAVASDQTAWIAFLIFYFLVMLAAIVLLVRTSQVTLALMIIAPPTLAAMIWKPLFGMCLLAAIAPMGRALVVVPDALGAERSLGFLLVLGTLANLLMTRGHLRWRHPVAHFLLFLSVLSALSILWATHTDWAIYYTTTMFQQWVYVILILTICRDEDKLLWVLRSFVIGAMLAIFASSVLGFAPSDPNIKQFSLAFGEAIFDSNAFAAVVALSFFTAVYLNRRESSRLLRWLWAVQIVVAPVVITMTASRGVTLSVALTLLFPLIFIRQLVRSPLVYVGQIILLGLLALIVSYAVENILTEKVITRLTNVEMARESFAGRYYFIEEAVRFVLRQPLGAGIACFAVYTGLVVHNDLFYLLSNLGFIGAGAFIVFIVAAWRRIRPLSGWERWFARAVLVFLLLEGLSYTQIFYKHFWLMLALSGIIHLRTRRPTTDSLYATQDEQGYQPFDQQLAHGR